MNRDRQMSFTILTLATSLSLAVVCHSTHAQPTPTPAQPESTQAEPGKVANPDQPADSQRGRGRRGRGQRGERGPAITVNPPADAVLVEKVPPLDKNGNFKVAVEGSWNDVPPLTVPEGTPRGTVSQFSLNAADSKFYPGTFTRQVWVYVPAGYTPGTELPLMVDHDARAISQTQASLITVLDTLIAAKRLPPMAGVFIMNGSEAGGPGSQRSLEYDTVSGKYAEFIEAEVLPVAEKTGNVRFTKDPNARGVIGVSSGAACALSMAWFHNDLYRRVLSYSGTFVNIRANDIAPNGAWDYHATLIPNAEKKPLRIWFQVGSRDNGATSSEQGMRNWPLANNRMAEVLKAKGYDHQYLWCENAPHADNGVTRHTLAQAMEWLWKDYQQK
jgi:enterochelin esterase-like enzyme